MYKRCANLSQKQITKLKAIENQVQLIADLSYSDITVYCRTEEGGMMVVALAKPNTSITIRPDIEVGQVVQEPPAPIVRAIDSGERTVDESGSFGDVPVRICAVPLRDDRKNVFAVMTSERAQPQHLRPSEMEQMYMESADDLIGMLELGIDVKVDFPASKEAGDGLLRIDANGVITYASPNAVTIYRRLGVTGTISKSSIYSSGLDETPLIRALEDRQADMHEASERGMTIIKRAIPLFGRDGLKGAIAIIRDVTEVRVREQQLKIKEATIREIHHRVKNNLQTIASLLRLQARRMNIPEARQALLESVGRISSIAVVHEILAQSDSGVIDFKAITENITSMIERSLVQPDQQIEITVSGTAGKIPSPTATSLSLVLTELLQNAIEHAFIGRDSGAIEVGLERRGRNLTLTVADDGIGLPKEFDVKTSSNLGLQIVDTLVKDELAGSWSITANGGTNISISVPIETGGDE